MQLHAACSSRALYARANVNERSLEYWQQVLAWILATNTRSKYSRQSKFCQLVYGWFIKVYLSMAFLSELLEQIM